MIPEDGTGDSIVSLTITNGADLLTNGNQLNVTDQTTLDGASSQVVVEPHTTPGVIAFQTADLDLNNGAAFVMSGGTARPGPVAGDPMEFMRVVIANTE